MKFIIIFLLFFISFSASGQGKSYDMNDPSIIKMRAKFAVRQKKIDSLSKADLYGYNYRYLDRNYNIKIPKKQFRTALFDQGYNPRVRLTRKDSLEIVLFKEFNDKEIVEVALQRVYQTWENVARHLDYSISQTKKLAYRLGLRYPDQLYRFLVGKTQLFSIKCQNIKEEERERISQILSLETQSPKEDFLKYNDNDLFKKLYNLRKY